MRANIEVPRSRNLDGSLVNKNNGSYTEHEHSDLTTSSQRMHNLKNIKSKVLTLALATMTITSFAQASTSNVVRVPSAGMFAPTKAPTLPTEPPEPTQPAPEPDVFNDGQFLVTPVATYSGLVGSAYTTLVSVQNVGAAIAMGATPIAVNGPNAVGIQTLANPLYCSFKKSSNQTLAPGATCRMSLSMAVPAPGTTTGYFSIGGTRVPLVAVGYTAADVSSFAATPTVYTTTEAQSGRFSDYIDVTLNNTSNFAGGFAVTGISSSSLIQHLSNNCAFVAAGGTCVVRLIYDNYYSPSQYNYPITINGTVRNTDGSKTASQSLPLTLIVTPRTK